MERKGIILAGGSGTRLHPLTIHTSKQLLPIYDKPMIYYPMCTLMSSGIRDILIISTPQDINNYKKLLGNGNQWGTKISYEVQPKPEGLAQALLIGEHFINNHPSALILGDNFFYGSGLEQILSKANEIHDGASVFAYSVRDPERYGVVNFDKNNNAISIIEKPKNPQSNYAVTGLYFYDSNASKYAKSLKPSTRGELEITDLNNCYINHGSMRVEKLDSGNAWFDMGTHDSLLDASVFVKSIETRQGAKIACPEEIGYKKNFITAEQFKNLVDNLEGSSYGNYLKNIF
ncbi:MAG: glucose-1-phosphate thymidylyltransferase RfbA [Gammaproteobacteria bacterium]